MDEIVNKILSALGDCKRLETSICRFNTSFEYYCNKEIYVHDDTREDLHPIMVVQKNSDYSITIKNRKKYNNRFCLIKSDKCLFNSDDHKKCDGIVLNNSNIYFFEISKSHRKNKKRNKASDQLISTLEIFKEKNIHFHNHNKHALICFKSTNIIAPRASNNSLREFLKMEYDFNLQEGNLIDMHYEK